MASSVNSRELSLRDVPQQGEVIAGKYLVEGVLGTGGMSVVLSAVHQALGQRVAIKVMTSSAAHSKDSLARFSREAKTASAIQNDHAVRILDIGRLETGTPYMAMEYLVGTNLADLVEKRGGLPVTESVDYVLQACEVIAEAHALGIIHRDMKPSNLFLAHKPNAPATIKVLDFGISKTEWSTADLNLTATTDVMGTPAYMSPEQVRSAKNADHRTDIWGVGAVLYELLTGQPPFWAENLPSLCAKILVDPPVPAASLRSDVPPDLDMVIQWSMQKDPSQRPQSIADFARELMPFASTNGHRSIEKIFETLSFNVQMVSTRRLPSTSSGAWQASAKQPSSWSSPLRLVLFGAVTGVLLGTLAVTLWLTMSPPDTTEALSAIPAASRPLVAQVQDASTPLLAVSRPVDTAVDGTAPSSIATSDARTNVDPQTSARPPTKGGGTGPLDERY